MEDVYSDWYFIGGGGNPTHIFENNFSLSFLEGSDNTNPKLIEILQRTGTLSKD